MLVEMKNAEGFMRGSILMRKMIGLSKEYNPEGYQRLVEYAKKQKELQKMISLGLSGQLDPKSMKSLKSKINEDYEKSFGPDSIHAKAIEAAKNGDL